jgi:hypothetical protein
VNYDEDVKANYVREMWDIQGDSSQGSHSWSHSDYSSEASLLYSTPKGPYEAKSLLSDVVHSRIFLLGQLLL